MCGHENIHKAIVSSCRWTNRNQTGSPSTKYRFSTRQTDNERDSSTGLVWGGRKWSIVGVIRFPKKVSIHSLDASINFHAIYLPKHTLLALHNLRRLARCENPLCSIIVASAKCFASSLLARLNWIFSFSPRFYLPSFFTRPEKAPSLCGSQHKICLIPRSIFFL